MVGSSEISVGIEHVTTQGHTIALALEQSNPAFDLFAGRRRSGRNDTYLVALPQRRRLTQLFPRGDHDAAIGLLALAIGHHARKLGKRLVAHAPFKRRKSIQNCLFSTLGDVRNVVGAES